MLILVNIKKTKFIIFLSEKTGDFLNRKRIFTFLLLVQLFYISFIINFSDSNYGSNFPNNQPKESLLKTSAVRTEIQYNNVEGNKTDITSLDIQLPDTTWNITDVNINFSSINLYRNLRTIENNISNVEFKYMDVDFLTTCTDGLGLQLTFSHSTTLYGAYVYGYKSPDTHEIVSFQIQGYNDIDNTINGSVIHMQNLDMSTPETWYFQDFSLNPVNLGADDYYIFLDGWYLMDESSNYSIGYNKINPMYPDLYTCERQYKWDNPGSGSLPPFAYQNEPMLCRIIEHYNRSYYPENIEMKAQIDGFDYNVNNTLKSGEGTLNVTNLNFYLNDDELIIPLSNINESTQLIYNLTYSVSLQKAILSYFEESGSNGKNTTKITGLPLEVFILFVISTIIIIVSSLVSYTTYRKKKIKKKNFRNKIFNKYMDVLNLNYVLVSDKLSGINIYEQMISGKEMNHTLLSGFLQAISSFGLELTGAEDQSQTIKLEYQKSKILMSDFKNYRLINVFEDNPSKEFMDSIEPLSQDIDKYYGKLLKNFDGETTKFAGIKELLEKHLQISLVYPLKVVITDNTKLNSEEKTLVYQAINFMKKKNSDYFYISYLMSEGNFNPKRAEKILGLIDRKIFRPIV